MGYIEDIFLGEYQIFFIECGEKSVFFMSADIFTARDEINLVFAKKVNFLLLLFPWSCLVRFYFCSVFIVSNNGCKGSLHLENA